MEKIRIITDKCIGCGLCVKDCVGNHLEIKNNKATAKEMGCIECGHCYAICPQNAIEMVGYETSSCKEVTSYEGIDADTLLEAMKSRRTIRQFQSKEIEQEKIDMILEAGHYAPTAANGQNVAYTILGSKQAGIEAKCVKLFAGAVKAGSKVVSYLKEMDINEHFFFKGAPLVIVVSAKSDVDGTIASSYMEVMANSLGLGVLYSGFFVTCTRINHSILRMLHLPKGHKVVTCMIMGYPAVKYLRQPPRKPIKMQEL